MVIRRWEHEVFDILPQERRANIDIVSSAYSSVLGDKAYLSMPITSGKRYYEILDHYGVKTVEELEKKIPGALREEIIIPNIDDGKKFAERLAPELDSSLIVPAIFEARRQRWTQEEYMVLWLRLLTKSVKEIYLLDGWEYSNGGAIEFARGLMIRYRFIEERNDRLLIYDHKKRPVSIEEGARKLTEAIKDLTRRGHQTSTLRKELGRVAGIAAYCNDYLTSRDKWAYHANGIGLNSGATITAAKSVGAMIALTRD
ncbi:MAG: DUF4406 domain-containing protein [Patescibacteria group bacterium]|nr:DUF4406 domain-containing protein [Patescibacteria group bacterium]MDE2014983.1 DUF4406 domain-containing protein [Patescibacteria group bacterium]MDE2226412.1 DUF4406 domain-containing protein [Patescibacteria group bacterium]